MPLQTVDRRRSDRCFNTQVIRPDRLPYRPAPGLTLQEKWNGTILCWVKWYDVAKNTRKIYALTVVSSSGAAHDRQLDG